MAAVSSAQSGAGPPVIFLHGFCDTHELWSAFVQPFEARYRVIRPDLPGFGKSGSLQGPFGLEQVAESLETWMNQENILKPVIIGHSLGGYVTLALVERMRDRIRAFGLFHSTAYADPPERKEVRNKVIEFVKNNGVQPYVDTLVPGLFFDKSNPHLSEAHARASQTRKETLLAYARAMRDRPDRSVLLREYELPKLLIGGKADTIIPIETLREQSKSAKNASFYELDRVGHMGIFEAKKECQIIITRFTDSLFSNKLN